jgi:hypothetical protein
VSVCYGEKEREKGESEFTVIGPAHYPAWNRGMTDTDKHLGERDGNLVFGDGLKKRGG